MKVTTDELAAEATEAEHEAIDLYHFIWRAAGLLGIASRERIEIGQRIAARRGTEPP
jgi:uncharacterized tellurite resistance protein B-like protein